ncbi:diguanylate cyclase domain-containing protein [Mycolicibacterium sp. CBM1]
MPRSQADQYEWITVYLHERGLQRLWRLLNFVATVALAASTALMVRSPAGPGSPLTVAVCLAATGVATLAAVPFLVHWPTRRQSLLFSLAGTVTISAACLSYSNPYVGLMGCTAFSAIGGFVAYFHTLRQVLVNAGVAGVCVVVLALRLLDEKGDAYLTAAGIVIVVTLNIAIPFGVESLVRTLRADLRSSGRDPLTGLHNRRSFNHSVSELVMRGTDGHLVVMMIDLDNFKQLNDTHGHAAGDAALIGVSAALEATCRRSAVIGRSGGEEFVVADVEHNPVPAVSAERLRLAIADTAAPVTASIGTASIRLSSDIASNPRHIDDLIHAADVAMYRAKRAGGNRVCHSEDVPSPAGEGHRLPGPVQPS